MSNDPVREQARANRDRGRCPAAHEDDRQRCEGPADAVIIQDVAGTKVEGCVLHGAIMLASLKGAKVYPGPVEGYAIEVFTRAQGMKPFDFPFPGREQR
ncbi:hypothetical protein ACWENQ_45670 [Nonomuraea sp. NPDC004354]